MPPSAATVAGIPLSLVSLVTLTVQNSALTIVLHYSRISVPKDKRYSAASAVLLNELLKCAISLAIAFRNAVASSNSPPSRDYSKLETGDEEELKRTATSGPSWDAASIQDGTRRLLSEVFSRDCWKLSIPACLYVVQNNLQFVAASNLDVPTFQVTYNLKILTTALFSVILLRRRLSPKKWFALLFLAAGVGVVQLQSSTVSGSTSSHAGHEMNQAKGLLAVMCACMTSGLAGVYFEMVLKGSKADLWIRNVQLSFFSLLPAAMAVVAPDMALFGGSTSAAPAAARQAIFANFGVWAWAVVSIQVLGGLVTALVIRYSDNIMKGFATSLAIVLSFCAGIILFDFNVTLSFLVGTAMVVASTYLYNQPDAPRKEGYTPLPSTTNSPYPNGDVRNTPVLTSVVSNGHANQYPLHQFSPRYPSAAPFSATTSTSHEDASHAAHRRPPSQLAGTVTPDVNVHRGFVPMHHIAMPQPRHASTGSIPAGLVGIGLGDSPQGSRPGAPASLPSLHPEPRSAAVPESPRVGESAAAAAAASGGTTGYASGLSGHAASAPATPDGAMRSRSPLRRLNGPGKTDR